jgi:hypothetical protein
MGLDAHPRLQFCGNTLFSVSWEIFVQGGPNFFFPRAKDSSPVWPKDQEVPSGTIFESE